VFSRRTRWNLAPNRQADLAARLRAAGEPLLDLTESNPTRAGIAYPEREILDALADPRALAYAPDPRGAASAREALGAYLKLDPARLVLTASTSEAYGWLFKLLCDPGDEVLAPRPSYPLFDDLTVLEEVALVPYRLRYDGAWHVDMPTVREAITERTRAILAVTPNNPTGNALEPGERDALLEICAERGLALIADEVFLEYPARPGEKMESVLAREAPALTFALSGLSKLAGLPQLKLGWIAAGGPEEAVRSALARLEVIADTYLSVNTPVQMALPKLLELAPRVRDAILARVRANRAWLASRCGGEVPYHVLPAAAGWYAILAVPRTRTDEEWAVEVLERDRVLVQPGWFFDMPGDGWLVVSLLPEEPVFRAGIERVLARVS
jgi:alanine-synthesizing transaminase